MLTADGEKSKLPKRTKVRFLVATLTYIYVCMYIYRVKRGKTEHLHSTNDYEARNKSNNFIL